MTTTTLRDLSGLDQTPASLSAATVILIDYQNTYTRGVMELTGWEEALEAGATLLARARQAGAPVIHVMNDGGPDTPYDIRTDIGAIHPRLAPAEGEQVVVKTVPDAFHGTDLAARLDAAGHKDVVIAGFMTHMCVTFTTAAAFLHGYRPTVVADACATRPLPTPLAPVPAGQLHHSALATITDLYGVVVPSAADLA